MTTMSPESNPIASQTCPHGEDRGPRKCALCRAAMPVGVRKADPTQTAAILRAVDPEPDQMLGFTSSLFAQVSMPYRDPGEVAHWTRRNGNCALTIQPAVIHEAEFTRFGYPYGVIPRLVMIWITTEVLRSGEKEIALEVTQRKFMDAICLPSCGKNIRALNEQLLRVAGSTMTATRFDPSGSRTTKKFSIASEWNMFVTDKDTAVQGYMPTRIILTDEFYRDLKHSTMPVDMEHIALLRAAGGGGLPIDIYMWLSRRAANAKQSSRLTWSQLAEQFGSQYAHERHFRKYFIEALAKVMRVYPGFKIHEWDHGLILSPGKPPVKQRTIPR